MNARMTRRAVIAAAPALALPAAAGAAPAAPAPTPIMRLFPIWIAQTRRINRLAGSHTARMSDERLDRLCLPRDRIEDRILSLPVEGPADFAAKHIVDTCFGELYCDWGKGKMWDEARALTGAPLDYLGR